MNSLQFLTKLGGSQLKSLSLKCGSPSSGSKPVVAQHLLNTAGLRTSMNAKRVLSIDMGVKNIGISVVSQPEVPGDPVVLQDWTLMSIPNTTKFVYPEFADRALDLLRDVTDKSPTSILIERQRARTNGSPNIPNDVLRTNVLEAMLFAGLRMQYKGVIDVESVNPKYVLAYWTNPEEKLNTKQTYRLAKKARLTLVSRWLQNHKTSPVHISSACQLPESVKRDDLNDSLVQAVSWFQWRSNSEKVLKTIEDSNFERLVELAEYPERLLI